MIGLDAGAAWAAVPEGRGRIRAVFSHAIHVELGGILVILDRVGPAGPLHLRVHRLPAVTVDDDVAMTGRRLQLGSAGIDVGSVPTWTPPRLEGTPSLTRLLGGRGPGLTPSGDDVLAGIVLTMHAFGVPQEQLVRAVDLVRSTDLSLAYLRWTARGHCIEPAHAVLAAATGSAPDRLEASAARLCAHGASSGADLLLGIELALVRTDAVPARLP